MKSSTAILAACLPLVCYAGYRENGMPPDEDTEALLSVAQVTHAYHTGLLDKESFVWATCWSLLRVPRLRAQRDSYCESDADFSTYLPMPTKLHQLLLTQDRPGGYRLPLKTPATHPHLFAELLNETPLSAATTTTSGTPAEAVGGPYAHWNGGATPGQPAPPVAPSPAVEFLSSLLAGLGQAALQASTANYRRPEPSYLQPPALTPIYPSPYQPISPNATAPTYIVKGYVRADGKYVAPYLRTYPDGVRWNNLRP